MSLTSLYITITLDTASPLIDQKPIFYCTSKPGKLKHTVFCFSVYFVKRINHNFIGLPNPLGILGEHSTFSQHSKWVFPPVNLAGDPTVT